MSQSATLVPNKERITWLVEALDSGEYAKGQCFLCQITGTGPHDGLWCCLGVASQVAIEHGLDITVTIDEILGDTSTVRVRHFGESAQELLSNQVREWYGFDSRDPSLRREDGMHISASKWNDYGPEYPTAAAGGDSNPEADFTQIAAAFRRTYLT